MRSPTSQRVRSSGENRLRRSSSALLVVCLVVAFVVPLMMIAAPSVSASPAWWNTSWTRRRPITITGSHPENYQIKVIIPYDSDMKSDYSDLRFTENEDGDNLSYWIENYTAASATVWVRRVENSDSTIYVYYGNLTATTTSDPSATFIRVIDNVVGGWSLDEGSGATTADNSGNNNAGTISGAAWTTSGMFGNALNFDGTGDNVNVGNAASLFVKAPLSVEAWIKFAGGDIPTSRRMTIASKYSTTANTGWLLDLADDSGTEGYRFWVLGTTNKWNATPSTDWTHIVGTYDNSNIILYVNADNKKTTAKSSNITDNGNVLIGSRNPVSGQVQENFKGIIDEVRIYSKALDNATISDLYNNYGYVTPNYPGKVLVRKYTSPEPTANVGSEEWLPLGQPSLVSPSNGITTNDNTPTFEWVIGAYAENHRLLVDNDPDFSSPEENRLFDNITTTFTVPDNEALHDENYSWKVVAITAGLENSSEIWTFVVSRVGRPTLVLPEDGVVTTDNTPTFEWVIGAYADNHRLLVDNDPDFSSPEENQLLGATAATYTIADNESLPDDNYSWKVIAISENGEPESSVWKFTVSKITVALNVQDWIGRAHGSRATIAFDALPLQYRGNLDGSLLRSASIAPEYWKLYGADNENTFTYSENQAVYWLCRARDNYGDNNYDNALYDMGIAAYYIGDAMTLPRNDNIWASASRVQYPSGWSLYRHFQEQARYYQPATPSPKEWRENLDDYISYLDNYLNDYASRWENDWSYWVSTRDCGYVKSASDNATQLIHDAWYSLLYEGSAGGGGGSGPAPRGGAGASDGGAVEVRWSFGLLSFGLGAALFLAAAIFTRRSSLGSGRRRHRLRKDKRGVSPVVGAVLVLSILVIAGTTFVTHWIPELQLKNEMDHTDAALDTWRKLQQAILNHENAKIEVKLGADPASILGLFEQALNPGTITVTPAKYIMRILPDNDAYVGEDVSSSSGNLWVQTYKDNNRRTYLKFDLSSLENARIYEARLVVYANISRFPHTWGGKTGYSPVPMLIEVMRVDNDNWSEDAISWANNPSYGDALVNEDKPSESTWEISYDEDVGVWYTFNVSSYVKGQRADNDDLISLCLKAPKENSTLKRYAWFRSKESASYRPCLQITYESVLESNWRSFDNWGSIADSGSVVFDVPNKRYDQYSFVFEGGALIKERYRENPILGVTDQEEYEIPQQPSSQTGGPILVANPPLVVGQRLEGDNFQISVNRYRIINRATYTGTGKAFLNVTVRENENLRWENSYDNVMVAIRSDRPQAWVGADPLLGGGYFTDLAGVTRGEWGSLDYSLGAESSDWGDISVRDFYANAITIYGRRLAAGIKDIKYVERVYDVTIDITTT